MKAGGVLLFGTTTALVYLKDTPWGLVYLGKTYDADLDISTFHYRMRVFGIPALSHWILELPASFNVLATSSSNPLLTETEMLTVPDSCTGLTGIGFRGTQVVDKMEEYSIRLRGNVREGAVRYSLRGGNIHTINKILGPAMD